MRQQKVARQIQKDISDILGRELQEMLRGRLVSVTEVRVSPDLSFAKVFISVFPFDKSGEVMAVLTENLRPIRHSLGTRVRNQLRIVPELAFALDDSLEYIEHIDNLLKS